MSATKIFARPTGEDRQILVYSMTIEANEELAMVLPIPTPRGAEEDAVRFIDMQEYRDFFRELQAGYPAPASRKGFGGPLPNLAVVEVGDYVASFVPTVKDFTRLDARFRLPEAVWDELPTYADYGFAVFQLKSGKQTLHPMAFEFPRADRRKLFFPTVHIHDGKVHPKAEFDHALYCQGSSVRMRWQESKQPARLFMPNLSKVEGLVAGDEHVYLRTMRGEFPNQDVWA